MLILQYVLIAVEAVVSILLLILILLQKTKSEGMGLAFGSGMGEALFGSRAGNVLTKGTIILTAVFLANTLFLSILFSGNRGQSLMGRSGIMGTAPMQPAPMRTAGKPSERPAAAPAAPASAVPTLPGANLGDEAAAPAAPADEASAPVPAQPAPVPAQPAPAP